MQNSDSPSSALELEEKDQISQYQFSFTGSGGEYFKIWIVNILLSICTLGIYSAWAKVRNHRYFYGNTQLNNASFEYHAEPMQILKGRLIAFSVFSAYILVGEFFPIFGLVFAGLLALIFPFFIRSSLRFSASMSSYRNVHFGFNGSLLDCYKYFLFYPLAISIVPIAAFIYIGYNAESDPGAMGAAVGIALMLGMLFMYLAAPFVIAIMNRFMMNNYRYGSSAFNTSVTVKGYYGIYIKWFFLGLVAVILMSLAIGVLVATAIPAQELIGMEQEGQMQMLGQLFSQAPLMIGIFVIATAIMTFVQAYLIASLRNYLFNNTRLDDVEFGSDLGMLKLGGILTVNALLIILTLGLYIPWAKVRTARCVADASNITSQSSLNHFIAANQAKQSALGDEFGEAFDVDVDLGLAL